jgi:hypothetical protein
MMKVAVVKIVDVVPMAHSGVAAARLMTMGMVFMLLRGSHPNVSLRVGLLVQPVSALRSRTKSPTIRVVPQKLRFNAEASFFFAQSTGISFIPPDIVGIAHYVVARK